MIRAAGSTRRSDSVARKNPVSELAYELVVIAVGADPEPVDAAFNRQAECSVVEAYSNAVEPAPADSLEMKRRMRWISPELSIVPVREGAHVRR